LPILRNILLIWGLFVVLNSDAEAVNFFALPHPP
jgi:hypothetical protein